MRDYRFTLPILFAEFFRNRVGNTNFANVSIFFQICQAEGKGVKELAFLCGLSGCTTTRAVQYLAKPLGRRDAKIHNGLVEVVCRAKDRRCRLVFLTSDGRQLKSEVEALIAGDSAAYYDIASVHGSSSRGALKARPNESSMRSYTS